jgi:Fur family zinc uptake transcriptional regulator
MPHDTHDHSLETLTKNEKLVYNAMKTVSRPQKAYDLLDTLKDKGVRAPMTIYRALEGLEDKGLVHKLDALNSFVLCKHEEPHQMQVFLVCDKCYNVEEIDDAVPGAATVESNIQQVSASRNFQMDGARLEVKGLCGACAA